MSILGGITGLVTGIGKSVEKNWKAIKGDKAAEEAAIHNEQIELLKQFAAEFIARPRATWWDSFVDGLNRLPRPMLTFSIIGIFVWAFYDPGAFALYMAAMDIVPDQLWLMFMTIVAFWFGSRLISQDIRKPKITKDQINRANEILLARKKFMSERRKEDVDERKEEIDEQKPIIIVKQPPAMPKDKDGKDAVEFMIRDLIKREGGYVNDPNDSGGPTKYGITQRTLSAWREVSCSVSDVKNLTEDEALAIYRAEYYLLPRIDALPVSLQKHVFDIGVNSGPRTAIRLLQRSINTFGKNIVEDGIIGPQTLDALNGVSLIAVNDTLVSLRIDFYNDIVNKEPGNKRFLNGWIDRANLFSIKEAA